MAFGLHRPPLPPSMLLPPSSSRARMHPWTTGRRVSSTPWPPITNRLILAASAVGTGKALPSARCHNVRPELRGDSGPALPEESSRRSHGLPQHHPAVPGSYQVSAATFHSQYLAAERWLAGQDAAGHLVGKLRVPTLVADGTLDQDTGPANARLLASSVPGAKLLLYDDAGHAFWFQDAASSSRPSRPLRTEFQAENREPGSSARSRRAFTRSSHGIRVLAAGQLPTMAR